MKTDEGLSAVRGIRTEISRQFGNDPKRLIAYYIELQAKYTGGPIIQGPDDSAADLVPTDDEHRPNQS